MREIINEYDELIRPVRIACSIIGCWPERRVIDKTSTSAIILRRCLVSFALLTQLACVFFTTIRTILFWGVDLNITIESILQSVTFSCCVFRICLFNYFQKDMLEILEFMRNDWLNSDVGQQKLLKENCTLMFKFAKYYAICVIITALLFGLMPLLETKLLNIDNDHRLPFGGYFFVNSSISPAYEITYSLSLLWGFIGSSSISGGTGFSIITTIHAAAKFVIVQKDFEATASSNWMSQDKVGKCVKRHQESIRFAGMVEGVINLLTLAQFVLSTLMVCFSGFQLTTMKDDKAGLIRYAGYVPTCILELYLFNYTGERLLTESERVSDCVFLTNWLDCTRPGNINIVIMRAAKPCAITAGKFYNSCHNSFIKVLSSSFSYLSVLLAMRE